MYKLKIDDSHVEAMEKLDKDFLEIFTPPPKWWMYLHPDGPDASTYAHDVRNERAHVNYMLALKHVREATVRFSHPLLFAVS